MNNRRANFPPKVSSISGTLLSRACTHPVESATHSDDITIRRNPTILLHAGLPFRSGSRDILALPLVVDDDNKYVASSALGMNIKKEKVIYCVVFLVKHTFLRAIKTGQEIFKNNISKIQQNKNAFQ